MKKAIDLHLILAMGVLFLFHADNPYEPVVAFLIAIISMELNIYFDNERVFYWIIGAYVLGCFFYPCLVFFLPVFLYEFAYRKKWWGYLTCFLFFVQLEVFKESWKMVLWGLLVMLSSILAHRTCIMTKEHRDLLELRNRSTEERTAMKIRNRELLEKQDYEIRVATLSERNRIAREIHDNVGHMLSRTILQLGALMVVYKKDEGLYEQLSSVNASLNEAMNNIRESVHDLHDESIDMKQAVLEATSEIKKNYNLRFDYDMTDTVPRNVKYAMISIVKEAMSNIVKHSNATDITIMLREHPGFYQLLIEDNGTGSKKSVNPGIGLRNMAERVETLGGSINFRTDNGFAILVSIRKEGREC